jgi:amidophosphoribosyltransferase
MRNNSATLHDYCGVFGISSTNHNVLRLAYLGLYALQHRGQESAGIAYYSKPDDIKVHKNMGLVSEVFSEEIVQDMGGSLMAIGHVRYSTAGQSSIENAQPMLVRYRKGPLAIAHNGNITNAKALRDELEAQGTIFQTQSDTEVIIHLISRSKKQTIEDMIADAVSRIQGAYCLLIMTENKIFALRDPHGYRPLCLGKIEQDLCIASEDCAFNHVGGEYIRDLHPGELVILEKNEIQSRMLQKPNQIKQCIFELIYLARPDSRVFNENVYLVRREMGKILACENPVDADLVVPVPDSGIPAALGYSQAAGIPYERALLRNHYVGRTFIEPGAFIRLSKIRIKLNPIKQIIEGKRLVVVDDSIVRGSTSKEIVQMLRQNGAREIHFRISSPPIHFPCYYGIDTPTKKELIANAKSIPELTSYLEVDSLAYLSLEGLLQSPTNTKPDCFCTACFTGAYQNDVILAES